METIKRIRLNEVKMGDRLSLWSMYGDYNASVSDIRITKTGRIMMLFSGTWTDKETGEVKPVVNSKYSNGPLMPDQMIDIKLPE